MALADYDFELPEGQIAQEPLPERDGARLLVLDRAHGRTAHRRLRELPTLLRPGDLLVVNDARVIPARLRGHKRGSGGRAELLLVRPASSRSTAESLDGPAEALEWIGLGQASKGLRAGSALVFGSGLEAEVLSAVGEGELRVRFSAAGSLSEALERAGEVPLPPYIARAPTAVDAERYQTVFARVRGSVAAPTAGLHLTRALLAALAARDIRTVPVTLDIGPGTFLPVRTEDESQHRMHLERYVVPEDTAGAVRQARHEGRRVVAVGTTVVRTLESATAGDGALQPGAGETALFIRQGHAFRQVDALLTNFHLPRSTLLMLVSAFAGRPAVLAAYREAVATGYRFFSYGDAMLIGDGA